jgi:hypothetical protein
MSFTAVPTRKRRALRHAASAAVHHLIEPLESRQLLTAEILSGTASADTFIVSRNEEETQIFVDVTTSAV